MNPYDFVRIDLKQLPKLRPYAPHDRFSGLNGHFEGEIELLTPTYIKHSGERQLKNIAMKFAQSGGNPILPGSSLKGLFRSVVETVGGCWWWLCNNRALPGGFAKPERNADLNKLDAACRLFGFLAGNKNYLGNVGFEDAVCVSQINHPPIYTPIHDSPKPRHTAWYAPNNQIAGRKFYFHHNSDDTGAVVTLPDQRMTRDGGFYNSRISPLGAGSRFTFRGHFENVAQDDLNLLLYALVLEPAMRHKLGFAKAAGLGSIAVKLTRLNLLNPAERYTQGGGGFAVMEGGALATYLQQNTLLYAGNISSQTLNDLRRIWAWPAVHTLRYPGQDWFKANPQVPIVETP